VIAAVEAGLSRRAAADRFGVAIASAVRWVREWRESGTARAKPQSPATVNPRISASPCLLASVPSKQDE